MLRYTPPSPASLLPIDCVPRLSVIYELHIGTLGFDIGGSFFKIYLEKYINYNFVELKLTYILL